MRRFALYVSLAAVLIATVFAVDWKMGGPATTHTITLAFWWGLFLGHVLTQGAVPFLGPTRFELVLVERVLLPLGGGAALVVILIASWMLGPDASGYFVSSVQWGVLIGTGALLMVMRPEG